MKFCIKYYTSKIITKFTYGLLFVVVIITAASCKKDFLDDKPRTDIIVPETLKDFQQLLDNDIIMNETPQLSELSADNFYFTPTFWNSLLNNHEKNGYIWAKDLFGSQKNIPDWNIPYTQVLYSNVVLEGIEKINRSTDLKEWDKIKGNALFTRAFAFYNIAQLFAPQYNPATATTPQSGIPLRTSSDINDKVGRSTVEETYKQILDDLTLASKLLPDTIHFDKRNRPSKPAAMALLSRVYLTMGNYDKSKEYADTALHLYNQLLNYNNPAEVRLQHLSASFTPNNKELIYHAQLYSSSVLQAFAFFDIIVDSSLYQSYDPTDLRAIAYYTTLFTGFPILKRSYNSTVYPFTGLAVDELYLTRAECNAWKGNITEAMADLNTLLETRWLTGTFTQFTASTQTEALSIILSERRKELAFRGLRWTDLRRLNNTNFKVTLQRKIGNDIYTLTPDSKNYVLPIPPDVLLLGGILQNDRQ